MTQIEKDELATKYPNLGSMTAAERDQLILNQLEILANELSRISKVLDKMSDKI